MNHETSFAQKMRSGWSAEQLKKYYCLNEAQYERVIKCIEEIQARR